jgi:hypothetical protein
LIRILSWIVAVLLISKATPARGGERRVMPWTWHEHTVSRGETLRLISRRYFGAKFGVFCLRNQLKLNNPDTIIPGTKLRFLAPENRMSLDELMASDLDCKPGKINGHVVSDGEAVLPKTPDSSPELIPVRNEKENFAPSEVNQGPSFWQVKAWSAHVGGGLTYSEIDQSGLGRLGFESLASPAAFAGFGLDFSRHWGLEVNWQSSPVDLELPATAQASDATFRWNSGNLIFRDQIQSWKASSWFGELTPGIRFGFGLSSWPLLRALDVNNITPVFANARQLKLGGEVTSSLSENWQARLLMDYAWIWGSDVERLTNHYDFDGAFELTRKISKRWDLGFNWQGEILEAKFKAVGREGQTQLLRSTVGLMIQFRD